MPQLPERPDLDWLRRQAKDLHRAAVEGRADALRRTRVVSGTATLSSAQLAIAREHGFASWPELKREVERRRSRAAGPAPAGEPSPVAQAEPPAGPELSVDALALIDRQYADRPHLRGALDAVLAALPRVGDTTIEVRTKQVSLVGPLRTYAYLQATTRRRVHLHLRLPAALARGGRIRAVTRKGVIEFGVNADLASQDDVDGEVVGWLRRAYDENAQPRPRRAPRPRPRPTRVGRAVIVIEGSDLPGRSCRPDPTGHGHFNIHAGLVTHAPAEGGVRVVPHRPWTVTGLVPGDAPAARWELEVRVMFYEDGVDLRGPAIEGERGSRHFGVAWGEVGPDGTFRLFRRFGFRLRDIDPELLEAAIEPGRRLVARLGLTDTKGNPLCAGIPRTAVTWSVEECAR